MKLAVTLLILIVLVVCLSAQETYAWAVSGGGASWDGVSELACDPLGNTYVTGYFYGTASYGTTTLTSAGDADIFIGKLDPAGNWLWAKRAGSSGWDNGMSIATDSAGNCYLTGAYRGNATFGATQLPGDSYDDLFVAKLDTNGNWLWAVGVATSDYERGLGICVDASGNSYITGTFRYEATFGTTNLVSEGGYDVLVAKLDPAGNWLWAIRAGGSSSDQGNRIDLDSTGNLYVTGRFWQTAGFGSAVLESAGAEDLFVAKLDSAGNWLWAKGAGGPNSDEAADIAVTAEGSCYVTGYFQTSAVFGDDTLAAVAYADIFVSKLDAAGNWVWTVPAGGNSSEGGLAVCTDAWSHCYVTGYFYSTVTFGFTELTAYGTYNFEDIFVAKLDPLGNWLWALRGGGGWTDRAYGIAVGPDGSCRVGGQYNTSAVFGNFSLPPGGGTIFQDIFVARLTTSIQPLAPDALSLTLDGADALLQWNPVTQDINGEPLVPAGYRVYLSTESPFRNYALLAQVSGTSWIHSGGALLPLACYVVKTVPPE